MIREVGRNRKATATALTANSSLHLSVLINLCLTCTIKGVKITESVIAAIFRDHLAIRLAYRRSVVPIVHGNL